MKAKLIARPYWKRRIDIITPLASTIISIIALIVAIIALSD
jgi:hypothetical protein